jgi:hypothetical protein
MLLKKNKAERNMQNKGFVLFPDGHHKNFYYHDFEGMSYFATYMSQGSGDLDDFLVSRMSKQLHLKKEQFVGVVDCTCSKEELREIFEKIYPEVVKEKTEKYLRKTKS